MADSVDLDDGYSRLANSLLAALHLFRLPASEYDVITLIILSAFGQATRSPGYSSRMSAADIVKLMPGRDKSCIYAAIRKLRARGLLTQDPDSLTINKACLTFLSPEDQALHGFILDFHNGRRVYSRPKLQPFKASGETTTKSGETTTRLYKDAHAGRERERLKSSSYQATRDFENPVPNSQTTDDDDEFKAQSQRLRQELARLGAQRTRKPEAELLAQIDSITGRTPEELALGMARLIDRMRADDRWGPINLRGLLAVASDPSNRNWGNATAQSVLSQLQTQAPAPPPVDQDALYAAALAAEREQRARRT